MFSLMGWLGQHGYNYLDAKNSSQLQEQAELRARGEDRPKAKKLNHVPWCEEYEKMMQEKLLRVEVDIAMIDDKIEMLRKQAAEMEAQRQAKSVQEQKETSK